MILHTVKQSPHSDLSLSQALAKMGPQDVLLLLENAVLAIAGQHPWESELAALAKQGRLYLIKADLDARGITPGYGHVIDYPDFVELVVEADTSLAW